MKERPILFKAEMVRAILEGRKIQTRRVVKNQHLMKGCPRSFEAYDFELGGDKIEYAFGFTDTDEEGDGDNEWKCPYGKPGDQLWVRESFSGPYHLTRFPPSKWFGRYIPIHYWADGEPERGDWTIPKPSIHMLRKFSRINLKITGIRVEQLQDISNSDAQKEGIPEYYPDALDVFQGKFPKERSLHVWDNHTSIENFSWLWDSINGKSDYSWFANPWVWVVEFERLGTMNDSNPELFFEYKTTIPPTCFIESHITEAVTT